MSLLRPGVEIALASGHDGEAVQLFDELWACAERYASPGFLAWAEHAEAMVALLESALVRLQRAGTLAESARVLDLLAQTCSSMGQPDQAARHAAKAAGVRERLGLPGAPAPQLARSAPGRRRCSPWWPSA
ncbi:hypothetical protein [Aestuariimicrobium sp. Y1814]|uniref:hypothetical protein n=1 Tax=Aestuariimicrobium sp. Y1814 TaxID=3418742 RepID=UPI003DA7763F